MYCENAIKKYMVGIILGKLYVHFIVSFSLSLSLSCSLFLSLTELEFYFQEKPLDQAIIISAPEHCFTPYVPNLSLTILQFIFSIVSRSIFPMWLSHHHCMKIHTGPHQSLMMRLHLPTSLCQTQNWITMNWWQVF